MLFRNLAVFRAGWTLPAAEQIAGTTLPTLMLLVDKSLVCRGSTEKPLSVEHDAMNAAAEPRFVMLEPIREYAL